MRRKSKEKPRPKAHKKFSTKFKKTLDTDLNIDYSMGIVRGKPWAVSEH